MTARPVLIGVTVNNRLTDGTTVVVLAWGHAHGPTRGQVDHEIAEFRPWQERKAREYIALWQSRIAAATPL